MWYWKTDHLQSRHYFSTYQGAMKGLEIRFKDELDVQAQYFGGSVNARVIRQFSTARLIFIPEGKASRSVTVEMRLDENLNFIPKIQLFPQERNQHELTQAFNQEANKL